MSKIYVCNYAKQCIANKETGQEFSYSVTEAMDGKEVVEGVDFELVYQMEYSGHPDEPYYWTNISKQDYDNTSSELIDKRIIAQPALPASSEGKKSNNNILPCPFCGGSPEWIHLAHPSGIPALRCSECQFSMQQDRRDKTIFYWNRRTPPSPSLPAKDEEGGAWDSGFTQIIKQTPLYVRLNVSNEMAFISLLTELGYRGEKAWTEDENELLNKLCKSAIEHTKNQVEEINEWIKDGSPPSPSLNVYEAAKEILKLLIGNSATPATPTEYGFHYDDLYRLSNTIAHATYQSSQNDAIGWVRVEERLPVKSGDYLTYETNHGIKVIGTMRFDSYNKQWFDDGDCYHPTHWMPLPTIPKQ